MKSLELVLLGGFQARAAGQVVDVLGRKERALLAVLAMPPGEPRSREKLAGLLWSDRSDKQARDSLKQALLRLRKSFSSLYPLPIVTDRAERIRGELEILVNPSSLHFLLHGYLQKSFIGVSLERGRRFPRPWPHSARGGNRGW